jgi:response regulator of citrate/malate metabolism
LGFDACGVTSNARDALSLAMDHPPDLTIMDNYLQGARDDIELARQMRNLFTTQ